jgi:hypothetical protein
VNSVTKNDVSSSLISTVIFTRRISQIWHGQRGSQREEETKREEFREKEREMMIGRGEEENVDGNHDLMGRGRKGGWES